MVFQLSVRGRSVTRPIARRSSKRYGATSSSYGAIISATEGAPGSSVTNRNPRQVSSATGNRPSVLGLQPRIFIPVRDADQPPVPRIAPRVIRTGQHLRAAAMSHRPSASRDAGRRSKTRAPAHRRPGSRSRSPRDIRGCASRPAARFADMANDLRRRAKKRLLLRLEEFGVDNRASRAGSCRRADPAWVGRTKVRGHQRAILPPHSDARGNPTG